MNWQRLLAALGLLHGVLPAAPACLGRTERPLAPGVEDRAALPVEERPVAGVEDRLAAVEGGPALAAPRGGKEGDSILMLLDFSEKDGQLRAVSPYRPNYPVQLGNLCVDGGTSTFETEPKASRVCLRVPLSPEGQDSIVCPRIGLDPCPCSYHLVEVPADATVRFRRRTSDGAEEFQIVPGKLAFNFQLGPIPAVGVAGCEAVGLSRTFIYASYDAETWGTGIHEWPPSPRGLPTPKGPANASDLVSLLRADAAYILQHMSVDELDKMGRWSILWDRETRVGTIQGRGASIIPMSVEHNRHNPSVRLNFPDGSALYWRNIFVSWRDSVPPEVIPPPGLLPGTEAHERCVHPTP